MKDLDFDESIFDDGTTMQPSQNDNNENETKKFQKILNIVTRAKFYKSVEHKFKKLEFVAIFVCQLNEYDSKFISDMV